MLWLKTLKLLNFKNYTEADLSFCDGVNVFAGNNGAGKTNILDAIHYLCLCKSYFNPIDSQQIKQNFEFFMIQGTFADEENMEEMTCALKKNQKKQFKRNKKEYAKLADHIGVFPLVMISPYDANLILDGSEERRKLMDNIISQTDKNYLEQLMAYNKNLTNRNSYLKQIAGHQAIDETLMQIFDEQLIHYGQLIYQKRLQFLASFIPLFDTHYKYISGEAESVNLSYQSQLQNQSFEELLLQNRRKDCVLERTTTGIHKDELVFTIHDMPLKKFGSQGQQKSFLIALKLAQYSYLVQEQSKQPLLLLDDIFDKLDDERIYKLMLMVSQRNFGQIFITDTNAERVRAIFENIEVEIKMFDIKNGVADVA